ncbi:3-phosphoinositide-dependent protein kinase 1 [Strongyloides ratti]|uniref:non-specific serine/threonine protein kinase n=1 Tax=Strongyloides ratti TaxID=34506 RepID=A0A090MYT5_STRRB|nr:3-phosphoinositide-dependent protein kinase 1 [Strongyloides ratti]CEF67744.1 3-phosphoinositide-dependent protein kinase 1 [Strongyloides ratti]
MSFNQYNPIVEEPIPETSFEGTSNPPIINYETLLTKLNEIDKNYATKLRYQLQFYFMDPIKKYKVRKQLPWKLMLQILKILFVTLQLVLFAELRVTHVDFLDETATVMRHKFLKDWSDERDIVTYPPSVGKYSVFTSTDLIEHFAFIINSYYSLHNDSFASFSYDIALTPYNESIFSGGLRSINMDYDKIPPLQLCIEKLASVIIKNNTYEFDIKKETNCSKLIFTYKELTEINDEPSNLREILARRNVTFNANDSLVISKLVIHFNLRTIHYSPVLMDENPECYLIKVSIVYDNSRHTGQIGIDLKSVISYKNICNGRVLNDRKLSLHSLPILINDIIVLFCSIVSLVLCTRSLFKSYCLQSRVYIFFKKILKVDLPLRDQLEFVNLWNVMIFFNDIFIIIGTICKVTIEFRDFENHLFTLSSIFLGGGSLLVYIGVLRYFGFFDQYNVIVLTLKKSLPNIMRFMVCTIILYLGFLFSGWVLIGPYSYKFRTISLSSETLFSLVNGDDMFPTFATINDSNTSIKIIAIIMDAYEIIKSQCSINNVPEISQLKNFISSAPEPDLDDPTSRSSFAYESLLEFNVKYIFFLSLNILLRYVLEKSISLGTKTLFMVMADGKKYLSKDDFYFLHELGTGSFSTVHCCSKKDNSKRYAIKCVLKKQIIRERKTHHIMREKASMMLLSTEQNEHPFVIKLYGTFQDSETLYFVMNIAEKKDVKLLLRKVKKFSVDQAKFIITELIEALVHIHSLNVIHRDVKPENLLISSTGHVILSDFGCSKILGVKDVDNNIDAKAKRRGSFVGTAQYVTPEILFGLDTEYSVDFWAAGVCLYQFLVGKSPFDDISEYLIFQNIQTLRLEFPDDFPDELAKSFIKAVLVLKVEERLGSVEMGGGEAVKNHPYFQGTNWTELPKNESKIISLL